MDPLIEGYLGYLDKVGRKVPRTIVDVRCTLRRAISGLEKVRPSVELWHLNLEDYLHWLEAERQSGCTESSLAKYLSHVRGLLDYAWRSGRTERNVLDGFNLQHSVRREEPWDTSTMQPTPWSDFHRSRPFLENCRSRFLPNRSVDC